MGQSEGECTPTPSPFKKSGKEAAKGRIRHSRSSIPSHRATHRQSPARSRERGGHGKGEDPPKQILYPQPPRNTPPLPSKEQKLDSPRESWQRKSVQGDDSPKQVLNPQSSRILPPLPSQESQDKPGLDPPRTWCKRKNDQREDPPKQVLNPQSSRILPPLPSEESQDKPGLDPPRTWWTRKR
ncbi:hypothetical protein Fcan01_00752 [Folsomia candida]|uniref:Uncharacterized protein n=1 Tax=Folsomia candida TaxID=158441 RepID=A0A226EYU1_FOLCA|nr:hypothetical protein Fcan01_00748 [Folsomia candida]OXA64123.1 hypothetical protein Fcan01_00752 [Folsomia candida]